MKFLDFRSDTVTRPTPPMREAIASAPVGDDVFGDDPTVHALEERVAATAGKEAALFVPSGTMSNQLALRCQTNWGDQILCHRDAHVYHYEGGAPSALSGLQIAPIGNDDGSITVEQIEEARHPDDIHCAPCALLALENTHNRCGGRVLDFDATQRVVAHVHALGLRTHLDGARLFNAAIASGHSVAEWSSAFDSVSLCLSKGLGAPVGSVLASSREVIDRARRTRKQWGGGMRQAGLLAAAGLYALDHHVDRLAEDHRRAKRLAAEFDHPQLRCASTPQTNIVLFECIGEKSSQDVVEELASSSIGATTFGPRRVRMVTHLGIDDADCDEVLERVAALRNEESA